MASIKINYKDETYDYESGLSLLEISKDFEKEYKGKIIVATVNNRLTKLDTKITRSCNVDFFDVYSLYGSRTYMRGLYFLFVKAVKDVLNADVKLMCFIERGIYCEVLTNNLISEVTVEKIKIRMRELASSAIPITKIMVSRLDAIDYFFKVNQHDKANSLRFISNSTISLNKLDDTLDYFYGVLPCNTSYLSNFNAKYLKDNKVMLLAPVTFMPDEKIKFNKCDKVLEAVERQIKYLQNIGINTTVELNCNIANGEYGDIIRMSETFQNDRLLDIVDKVTKDKDIKMILLTGPSSSGKTTMSRKISLFCKMKGYNPIPISVDNFYTDMKDRVLDENGKPEIERIEAFDTNQFNKKISELLNGKEVILPRYNFIEGKQEFDEKNKIKLEDKSILIVEGIHAFNEKLTEIIPSKNKFKVFICPLTPLNIDNHNLFKSTDNRLLRRIVRDNRTRGASASDTLKMWKKVREIEEEMIFPYMKEADEILNTSLVYELGVLKTYAEPLLFSVSEDDPNYDEALRLINLFRVILGIPSEEVPHDSIIREFIDGSCFKDL